jgi:hypothetical protein
MDTGYTKVALPFSVYTKTSYFYSSLKFIEFLGIKSLAISKWFNNRTTIVNNVFFLLKSSAIFYSF